MSSLWVVMSRPRTLARPDAGVQEAEQEADGRGLARPVGAQEAEDLRLVDLDAEVVKGTDLARPSPWAPVTRVRLGERLGEDGSHQAGPAFPPRVPEARRATRRQPTGSRAAAATSFRTSPGRNGQRPKSSASDSERLAASASQATPQA